MIVARRPVLLILIIATFLLVRQLLERAERRHHTTALGNEPAHTNLPSQTIVKAATGGSQPSPTRWIDTKSTANSETINDNEDSAGRNSEKLVLKDYKAQCPSFPGAEDVLVVLKTGATEIQSKLPAHFSTTLACATDYLIFSDLAQTFGDLTVHDALESISNATKSHADFNLYRKLHERYANGGRIEELSGAESWNLDKWKFLPMITTSLEKHPDKKWFIFIEADTHLSWPNLLHWLSRMNPEESVYAGSAIFIGDTRFAHGGSGILLSRPAAKTAATVYAHDRERWEQKISNECCGDMVLAEVLAEGGVKVMQAFPLIQGETVSSLDWSDRHWCVAAVTWHHVSSEEIDALWDLDRKWVEEKGLQQPILFCDIWEKQVRPKLREEIEDWDNMSKGWIVDIYESAVIYTSEERASTESAAQCQKFCQAQLECLQWTWKAGFCGRSAVMRLGTSNATYSHNQVLIAKRLTSGWMLDRIEKFVAGKKPCGDNGRWITAQYRVDTDIAALKSQ